MARDLDSLLRLQSALSEAQAARTQLEGVPDSMRELHEVHHQQSSSIQALDDAIQEAELGRRAAEAAAQDAQVRLEKFQEHVNKVSTQREYGSLLSEIDTARAEMSEHEETALAEIERAEESTTLLETERTGFEELDTEYQEALAVWEKQKPAVKKRLDQLESEVEELRTAIPGATLMRFQRLFERQGGQALASISTIETNSKGPAVWHCSNCNYRVRPQVVVNIRNNGSLNQCESCQRFLFWQEDAN